MKKVMITGTILVMMSLHSIYGQKFAGLAATPPMGWNSWTREPQPAREGPEAGAMSSRTRGHMPAGEPIT